MKYTDSSHGDSPGFMAPETHAQLLDELQTLVGEHLDGPTTIESRLRDDGSLELFANHTVGYDSGVGVEGAISPVQENERIRYNSDSDTFEYIHFTEYTHETEGKQRTILDEETLATDITESSVPDDEE